MEDRRGRNLEMQVLVGLGREFQDSISHRSCLYRNLIWRNQNARLKSNNLTIPLIAHRNLRNRTYQKQIARLNSNDSHSQHSRIQHPVSLPFRPWRMSHLPNPVDLWFQEMRTNHRIHQRTKPGDLSWRIWGIGRNLNGSKCWIVDWIVRWILLGRRIMMILLSILVIKLGKDLPSTDQRKWTKMRISMIQNSVG